MFQQRGIIFNLGRVKFVFDIGRNIRHRPRAIERNARDNVFQTVGLEILHEPLHAPLFELEHGVGIPFGNQSVRLLVFISDLVPVDDGTRVLEDIVARLFYIGEGRQGKEVHLEHADRLNLFHIELGGDVLAVSRERHRLRDGLAADDDARRMHGSIARHALQFERHVDDAVQLLVRLVQLDKFVVPLLFLLVEVFAHILAFFLGKVRIVELLF